MPDASQVTTLIVAVSILVVAVALVGGGAVLAAGGRLVLGGVSVLLGLVAAAGALFFTLSPMVARRYRPGGPEDGDEG